MKQRVLAGLLLVTSASEAQNLRSLPVGGRTATMGGAAVASGDDSAMPLVNPAGVARQQATDVLSVSASLYGFTAFSVPQFHRPTGSFNPSFGALDVKEESYNVSEFMAVPTGLTYFKTVGGEKDPIHHTFAGSVHSPTFLGRSASGSLRAESPTARLQRDDSASLGLREVFFGPSYAMRVGDRLQWGVSLFGSYTQYSTGAQIVTLVGDRQGMIETPRLLNGTESFFGECFGLTLAVGAQLRLFRELWAGLAVETPGIPLASGGAVSAVIDRTDVDSAGAVTGSRRNISGGFKEFKASRPMRIAAGISYHHPKAFTFAADVIGYIPVLPYFEGSYEFENTRYATGQPVSVTSDTQSFAVKASPAMNVSFGAEIEASPQIQIRGGFLTDLDVRDGGSAQQFDSKIDWLGWTAGIGMKGDPFGATYGVSYRYGIGKQRVQDVFNGGMIVPTSFDAHAFFLILSGTIEVGAPVDLMSKVQKLRALLRTGTRAR